jgi:hypothetical protein
MRGKSRGIGAEQGNEGEKQRNMSRAGEWGGRAEEEGEEDQSHVAAKERGGEDIPASPTEQSESQARSGRRRNHITDGTDSRGRGRLAWTGLAHAVQSPAPVLPWPPDSSAPPHSPPFLSTLPIPLPPPLSNELTRWGLWRVGAVGAQWLLSRAQQLLSRTRASLRSFPARARGAFLSRGVRLGDAFCCLTTPYARRTRRLRHPISNLA